VSPLVTWLWLGALIMAAGGLIALWPLPERSRRRAYVSRPASMPAASAGAPAPAATASLAVRERV
jgi:hypothetical protein